MHKEYAIGDIVAIQREPRAVSCKVIAKGMGVTKSNTTIFFDDNQVLWRLGHNGKWPSFVQRAFRK